MLWLNVYVCVCVCCVYQTMWQNADVTACVVAQTPARLLLSRLSLSSVSASRKQTDVKQKAPPSFSRCFCLPLSQWFMCVNRQADFAAWFRKTQNVNECVYDWEESFNHIKERTKRSTKTCVILPLSVDWLSHNVYKLLHVKTLLFISIAGIKYCNKHLLIVIFAIIIYYYSRLLY